MNLKFINLIAIFAGLTSGCTSTLRVGALEREGADIDQILTQQQQPLRKEEAMYRLLVAEVAGQRGQFDTSIQYLMSTLEQTADPKIAEHATQVGLYAQDFASAYTAAQRWIELTPEDEEANRAAAFLALHQGEVEAAVGYLRRILDQYAEDKQQGFLIVASLLGRESKGRSTDALKIMRQLVSENQQSPYAFFAYGNLAAAFSEWEVAQSALTTALQLQPDYAPARILYARVLRELGQAETAITELAASVRRNPTNSQLRLAYARMLLTANRYPEARAQYEVLLGEMPNDPDLIYTLALLNLDMDELDRANIYFQRLLETENRTAESYYYLGRIAEIRRQHEAAIQNYFKVSDGEYRLDAQIRIGHLLGQLERMSDARRHLNTLREQSANPATKVRVYLEEALLLENKDQTQLSIELLSDALIVFPGNTDLLYTRGLAYEKVGRLDLLERDMQKILDEDPENADALNTLGYTLANRTNRYREAYGLIRQAIKLKPDNAAIIDSMGWVLYRMGKHQESLKFLKQALNMQFDAEIAAHLGEVLWVAGDRKEAESVLRHALEREPKDQKLLDVMEQLNSGGFRSQ